MIYSFQLLSFLNILVSPKYLKSNTLKRRLSELISDKGGSDNWIKLFPTKNTMYCPIIIIKTKKFLKQMKQKN
jgi:hypothetical protein